MRSDGKFVSFLELDEASPTWTKVDEKFRTACEFTRHFPYCPFAAQFATRLSIRGVGTHSRDIDGTNAHERNWQTSSAFVVFCPWPLTTFCVHYKDCLTHSLSCVFRFCCVGSAPRAQRVEFCQDCRETLGKRPGGHLCSNMVRARP